MQKQKHISLNRLFQRKSKMNGRKSKNKSNSVGMFSMKIVYSEHIKRELGV